MRFEYMDLIDKVFQLVEMEAVVVLFDGGFDIDKRIDNLFIANRLGRVVHGHVKSVPQIRKNLFHPPEGQFPGQALDIAIVALHQAHAQFIGHIIGGF